VPRVLAAWLGLFARHHHRQRRVAASAARLITPHNEDLDQEQHLDAVLVGPGHPLYAALDERLNEKLRPLIVFLAEQLRHAMTNYAAKVSLLTSFQRHSERDLNIFANTL
jgi:hypothetical protein